MKLFRLTNSFGFSTSAALAQKTFNKFNERYNANLQQFKKKITSTTQQGQKTKRSTLRAYVHPLNEPYRRVFDGVAQSIATESEFRGPQQVSPHYEHFSFARRQALVFFGGLAILRFIAATEDFFMFGQSGTYLWTMYFAYNYFWVQGKHYFLMPLLLRFYKKISTHQMVNVQTYWAQNTEARVRNLMLTAKEQVQFKAVHADYLSIRNNSLLNFLISQQIALKNHIHARAEHILKEVEYLQSINQNKVITNVMSQTLKSIDIAYQNNKQKINDDMFKLALQGISKGRMDYANDPILPYVIQTINKTIDKFSKISKEEQQKLVSLTEDQINDLRNADVRARDEFILTEPKIDGSLRNNPTVSKILSGWGK